jgi:YbbR domain-containing protein
MAWAESPPSVITARIRDKGSALLAYTWGHKKALVDVNFRESSGLTGKIHLSSKDIETILMKQMTSTTSLLSFDPQQIDIAYSKLIKKSLPVHFEGDIHTAPGYLVSGEIIITPSSVDVHASDRVLDTLKVVQTLYTEVNDGNKTLTCKVKLRPVGGAVFVPDQVTVLIPIEEYTEKTVEIQVISKYVPEGYAIRMFPSTVKLSCYVPLSLFKELSEDDFSVEVSLADLAENVSGMLPIRLTHKPEWVDKVTLSQDSIEFILERSK